MFKYKVLTTTALFIVLANYITFAYVESGNVLTTISKSTGCNIGYGFSTTNGDNMFFGKNIIRDESTAITGCTAVLKRCSYGGNDVGKPKGFTYPQKAYTEILSIDETVDGGVILGGVAHDGEYLSEGEWSKYKNPKGFVAKLDKSNNIEYFYTYTSYDKFNDFYVEKVYSYDESSVLVVIKAYLNENEIKYFCFNANSSNFNKNWEYFVDVKYCSPSYSLNNIISKVGKEYLLISDYNYTVANPMKNDVSSIIKRLNMKTGEIQTIIEEKPNVSYNNIVVNSLGNIIVNTDRDENIYDINGKLLLNRPISSEFYPEFYNSFDDLHYIIYKDNSYIAYKNFNAYCKDKLCNNPILSCLAYYNASGEIIWTKYSYDFAIDDIFKTEEDKFLIGGHYISWDDMDDEQGRIYYATPHSAILSKMNLSGNILWTEELSNKYNDSVFLNQKVIIIGLFIIQDLKQIKLWIEHMILFL